MRYQIYTALWDGTSLRHVLFYEKDGTVFRFQSKRISYVRLPVQRLEQVTVEMVRLGDEIKATPILHAPDETEPLALLRDFEATQGSQADASDSE